MILTRTWHAALLTLLAGVAAHAVQAPELPVRLLFTLNGFASNSPYLFPEAVQVDPANRTMYVADSGNNQIGVSSLQGVPGFTIESGPDFAPISLATLGDGRLLATDRATGGVKLFDSNGKLQAELNLSELSALDGVRAGRITVDREGSLYAIDSAHGEVLVFDFPWKLRLRLGARDQRVRFKIPEDVAVDRTGRIYVSDSLGVPITVFDSAGNYLSSFGRHGDRPAELSSPTSLWVDELDQIWLTDTLRSQIVVYNRFGVAVRVFGQVGQQRGQLFHPVDLALDGLGRIYIAEREGRRVQVFAYDRPLDEFPR